MTRLSLSILCAGVLFASSCGEDAPADAAGTYTINVTNRDNGCEFQDYVVGESTTNVPVTITQDGSAATATVDGIAGAVLTLRFGSNVFEGDISGTNLMLLMTSRALSDGNCAYTINANLDADLRGDILEGEIRYTRAGNGNSDCAALEECVTVQEFNGSRPPQ